MANHNHSVNISYRLKDTQAQTQYVTMKVQDLVWLQSQLIEWLVSLGQLDTQKNNRLVEWWHQPTNRLHHGRQGTNSPCTTTSGILYNLLFKQQPQQDLSIKQLEDIARISRTLSQNGISNTIEFQERS